MPPHSAGRTASPDWPTPFGLRMKARGETDRGPQRLAECPPDLRGELGANILGDPMEMKHMEDKKFNSFESGSLVRGTK